MRYPPGYAHDYQGPIMRKPQHSVWLCLILCWLATACLAVAEERPGPESANLLADGAEVYVQRCINCHGNAGMGEGALPLRIEDYPNTNLFHARISSSLGEIRNAIAKGAKAPGMSALSPPWEDELTEHEIEAVSHFVYTLRKHKTSMQNLLADAHKRMYERQNHAAANLDAGRVTYQNRCAQCHGASGKGDGKMSRIITAPPPFDLTTSIMPPAYLKKIIAQGGAALGRSGQMPPWQDTLNQTEQDSVIAYVISLRTPVTQ